MKRWFDGFRYAFEGIWHAVRMERHMRFHLIAAATAAALGVFSDLDREEWLWVALAIALVWTAELLNTAIERTVDLVGAERHPLAKAAKDTAAGAVLVLSLFAAVVGAVVLLPAFLNQLMK